MTTHAEPVVQSPAATAKTSGSRLLVLDRMRGIVMLLMALDHASGEFNAGRVISDSAFFYKAGTVLEPAQFLTRWLTHLCAPTFVFLAGVSLSMSLARRVERGEPAQSIDRYLLVRGLLIIVAELVPSYFWMEKGRYLLQVLYAIGSAYLCMIPLRRLPVSLAVALGAFLVVAAEGVTRLSGWGPADSTPWLATLLLTGGLRGWLVVAYPTLPWLAMLLLGWGYGHVLRRRPSSEQLHSGELARTGVAALVLFGLVRAANAYGNAGLPRDDGSLVQWLHVSKYPPSLSYTALELGLMLLLLAALAKMRQSEQQAATPSRDRDPLVVFGQTPMFFYLLHIPLLALVARALHVEHGLGLGAAYGFAALAALSLFPACIWYRRYRAAHPASFTRYI
jgi:uncharacterized membrane protein